MFNTSPTHPPQPPNLQASAAFTIFDSAFFFISEFRGLHYSSLLIRNEQTTTEQSVLTLRELRRKHLSEPKALNELTEELWNQVSVPEAEGYSSNLSRIPNERPPASLLSQIDFLKPCQLDANNFYFWHHSVRSSAAIIEVKAQILTDPLTLTDPASSKYFSIKQAKVRSLIMQSIPYDRASKLDPSVFTKTPHAICQIQE